MISQEDSVQNPYMEDFAHGKFVLCTNSQNLARDGD